MKHLFDLDNPIIRGLGKFADLMILNILYLISCIPLFTIGAATAALYDVTHRLSIDDALLWKNYWQAFRSNFKQATCIWLILFAVISLIYICAVFYWSYELPNKDLSLALLAIAALVCICAFSWAFPLQARFENTVRQTLVNSLLFSWSYLPKTLLLAILNAVPAIVFLLLPGVFVNFIYVFLFIWFSGSAYLCTLLLKKNMKQLEAISQE